MTQISFLKVPHSSKTPSPRVRVNLYYELKKNFFPVIKYLDINNGTLQLVSYENCMVVYIKVVVVIVRCQHYIFPLFVFHWILFYYTKVKHLVVRIDEIRNDTDITLSTNVYVRLRDTPTVDIYIRLYPHDYQLLL